jgi:hypothetical protein
MKTTILWLAMIVGCATASLAQVNRNRKMATEAPRMPLSYPTENKEQSSAYNSAHKFGYSLSNERWSSNPLFLREMAPLESAESTYPPDHMPCLKPTDIFSMRIYTPDSTINFTILLKKF